MKSVRFIFVFSLLATCSAFAHEGPRVWVDVTNGKITTLTSDNDLDPTIYTPSRLFTTDLDNLFGVFTTNFPGYEVPRTGGSVSSGTTFGFNITGPALFYDSATNTFVTVQSMFGPPDPGPVPQIAVSLSETRVTDSGPVSGFDFYTFNQVGDHAHLFYTLFGDGSTASDGPPGVYAISLNLTAAGLTTSDTFYLLIGKEVEQDDPLFLDAIAAAEDTLVNPAVAGDMDCSGEFDAADVPAFIEALLNPTAYAAHHPGCDIHRGDMNGDGVLDGLDIRLMVANLF